MLARGFALVGAIDVHVFFFSAVLLFLPAAAMTAVCLHVRTLSCPPDLLVVSLVHARIASFVVVLSRGLIVLEFIQVMFSRSVEVHMDAWIFDGLYCTRHDTCRLV